MSFSENTEKLVNVLIDEEYKNACNKYGSEYHSLHEAYAVLKEEIEEAETEIKFLKRWFENIWESIKTDNITYQYDCIEELKSCVENSIKELAQVGAVVLKIRITPNSNRVCNPDCECIHREYDKWTCGGQKNTPYVELGDECPYQDEVEE